MRAGKYHMFLAWIGASGVCLAAPVIGQRPDDAAQPWNRYALTVSYGSVSRPVTLFAHDGWRKTVLGSKGEWDVDWTVKPGPSTDISLGVSHLRGRATVWPEPAFDIGGRTLVVNATQWTAHALARHYRERRSYPFDPWLGGGVAVGTLNYREQERAATPGGPVSRPTRKDAHAFVGGRVMAGLDIHPFRDSSLLLRLQARYDMNAIADGFRGHTNGYAVQVGIRWNLWPAP